MAGLGNLALGTPLVMAVLAGLWLLQRWLEAGDRRRAPRPVQRTGPRSAAGRPAVAMASHQRVRHGRGEGSIAA